MKKRRQLLAVLMAAAMTTTMMAGCGNTPKESEEASDKAATLVLRNGVIQTMVSEDDTAEAVAINGDEIVYVGDEAGIEAYIGEETEVIDLNGGMVTPGFMDGHMHAGGGTIRELYEVSFSDCETNDDYVAAVKMFADEHPDAEVITGGTFDLNNYAQSDGTNPGPSKEDLDAVCSDKPVILWSIDEHSFWVNSKALEMGGVTADTPDPSGGKITRNADGSPRGMLTDNAQSYVMDILDTVVYTDEELRAAAQLFQEEAHALGMTGMTTFPITDAREGFELMDKDGELSLRLKVATQAYPEDVPEELIAEVKEYDEKLADSEWMDGGLVKMFADGVTEGVTAVFIEPYQEEAGMGTDYKGEPLWTDEQLNTTVAALDKEGIQVHIHAIGDGAVNQSLNAFENAAEKNGTTDSRFSMTHVCAITDEDVQRVADLGVVSAMQFLWMYADPLYQLEQAMIGEERAMAMYPMKDMQEAGCILAGASDAPVTPYNVLEEIEVAVTRNSPYPGEDTEDMYRAADQAITAYQALEAYTKNVAYENFWEDELGTIEVGKKADLVVLGDNILKCDPKAISDTPILYTIAGGQVVYEGK